jgi:hypothetical protein
MPGSCAEKQAAAGVPQRKLTAEVVLTANGRDNVYTLHLVSGTQSSHTQKAAGQIERAVINVLPVFIGDTATELGYQIQVEFKGKKLFLIHQAENQTALGKESLIFSSPTSRLTIKFTLNDL